MIAAVLATELVAAAGITLASRPLSTAVAPDSLMVAYAVGWPLATVALIVSARWLRDRWSPAPSALGMTALAGAIWPVLLVGVIEFWLVSVAAKCIAGRREVPR